MSSESRSIGHRFREIYMGNPLLGSKLVFASFAEDLKRLLEAPESQRLEALGMELEKGVEDSQEVLNREIDALEVRLATAEAKLETEGARFAAEKNPKTQAKIKEGIRIIKEVIKAIRRKRRELEDQMDRLDKASPSPNFVVMDGLMNNVRKLDELIAAEENKGKQRELELEKAKRLDVLAIREAPITNADDLNAAATQVEQDQRLLDILSNEKFNQVDLELLLTSDMLSFIDASFEGALQIALGQMFTSDGTQRVLARTDKEKLEEDVDFIWQSYKEKGEAGIAKLEEEEKDLVAELSKLREKGKAKERRGIKGIKRRLKEIESEIKRTKDQLENRRLEWTKKTITNLEINHSNYSVLGSVRGKTLIQLKSLIEQAQALRMEKIHEYLAEETDGVNQLVNEQIHHFDAKQQASIRKELAIINEIVVDQGKGDPKVLRELSDPATLRELAENFQNIESTIGASVKEVTADRENRGQREAQIVSDYARYKSVQAGITAEQIEKQKKLIVAKRIERGFAEDSFTVQKDLAGLDILGGKDATIRIDGKEVQASAIIEKMEAEMADMSKLSDAEIAQLYRDLQVLMGGLALWENPDENMALALGPENQDAKLAHETIEALEDAESHNEVMQILNDNLGLEFLRDHRDKETKRISGDPSKHVKIIPSTEFNAHSDYTKEGKMVFYERGDEWYILIDETAFKSQTELEKLKKQVTHELLHLEFEKNENTKDSLRAALIEKNPQHWREIKAAFIAKEKYEGKKAPDGSDWIDDPEDKSQNLDVLSELYAMQNEMPTGQNFIEVNEKTPEEDKLKANLHNLFVGARVADTIKDVSEKTSGYKEDPRVKERGYAGGAGDVEAGEEARDPSKSVTAIETLSKGEAVYKSNNEKIKDNRERLAELNKSEYLDMVPGAGELVSAMDGFNEATDGLNRDFKSDPDSEILAAEIEARINKVAGDLTDVEDKIGKAARKAPNTEISLMRKLWINTTFTSIEDFVQMGTDVYEFFQRRHKRKVADHAAKLGMAIFHGTDLGREATAREQKAEAEEVNEWKSRYEEKDPWYLEGELKSIANAINPSQDQFKAIIRILADKGRLDWQNEDLWTILNKLQSAVVLKPGDQLLLRNPILLRQRLHRALGEIYDFDEFTTLERTNESTYQSEKGKYETVHNRMQDKLTDRLDELLIQHRDGEQVDPILFESIMEYSIKNGKSYAENVMFHLIAGMAEGLLAPDRGLGLGEHLNTWPAIDWFSTMSPPMSQADWKRLCMQNFRTSFMKGSISAEGFGDDFKNFYWTTIQNNNRVIERVKKSVSERSWDHDWGRSIACMGDADTAKRFLSGRSGQQETKATAVGNAYVGAIQWIEENAKNPEFANKDNFARMTGWLAMSEGILDGTAYNRKENDISTRANEAMNQDMPRESGVGRHGTSNTGEHRDMAKAFLFKIDSEFFGAISGKEARSDAQKSELGLWARDYLIGKFPSLAEALAEVEVIDQIYNNLDLIITTMFGQMSPARFQEILSEVAPVK